MTRGLFNRIAMAHIRKGKGSPNGGLYIDLKKIPYENIAIYYRRNLEHVKADFGYDWMDEPVEVVFEWYETCGCPPVDARAQTTLPRLYCAPGGGSRGVRGGNSWMSCFGVALLAADSAGKSARNKAVPGFDPAQVDREVERISALLNSAPQDPVTPVAVMHQIQAAVFKGMGPERDGPGLTGCLAELQRIRTEELPHMALRSRTRVYNLELRHAIEVINILDDAKLIIGHYTSTSTRKFRYIMTPQLLVRVLPSELPLDGALLGVSILLPGGDFAPAEIPHRQCAGPSTDG